MLQIRVLWTLAAVIGLSHWLGVPASAAPPYGGYDLQRGDRDTTLTYGGVTRSPGNGDVVPVAGETKFVEQLQEDLYELGFRIVADNPGNLDGQFGPRTEWAVREFQIYAKMPRVAREAVFPSTATTPYLERLSSVPNDAAYTGPVSGVANTATRAALQHWIAQRWRCPVVIGAYRMVGGTPQLHKQNIWLHDDVAESAPRMFVRDFSGYYPFPPTRNPDVLQVLGDFRTYTVDNKTYSGPNSEPPRHTWTEAEITHQNLTGKQWQDLTATEQSTYRVIRAVSEEESNGYYDSINAYDDAIISAGPYHWTLGPINNGAAINGELGSYLAYLRRSYPSTFDRAFGAFGIRPDRAWQDESAVPSDAPPAQPPTGSQSGQIFNKSQRKYECWIEQQTESGTYSAVPRGERETEYFRGWHWFYRFSMAGRTMPEVRRAMWGMARIRLRDILSTPWGSPVPGVANATIGDIFKSEQSVALLLRWHIKRPGHIVTNPDAATNLSAVAGKQLVEALQRSGLANRNPATWNRVQEQALVGALLARAGAVSPDLKQQLEDVRNWSKSEASGAANVALKLSDERGSFLLDQIGNIPPA